MARNPVAIKVELSSAGEYTMRLSLLPDALLLRTRYGALVCHYHNVPDPVVWDLGKDMDLIHSAPALGAPMKISITIYGVSKEDGAIVPLYRNWGRPGDGFPLDPATPS